MSVDVQQLLDAKAPVALKTVNAGKKAKEKLIQKIISAQVSTKAHDLTKKKLQSSANVNSNDYIPPIVKGDTSNSGPITNAAGLPNDPQDDSSTATLQSILNAIKGPPPLQGAALLSKINAAVDYLKAHAYSPNNLMAFLQIMIAIGQNMDKYNGDTKNAVAVLMNSLKGLTHNGVTFGHFLANMIRNMFFYGTKSKEGTVAGIDKVIQLLGGATKNPFISDLLKNMNAMKDHLDDFFSAHWVNGAPDMDSQLAFWAIEGDGNNGIGGLYDFLKHTNTHTFYTQYIDQLIKEIESHKGKFGGNIAQVLVLFIFGYMDSENINIGAYGDLNKDLKDQSDIVNRIIRTWQKNEGTSSDGGKLPTSWTPNDLKKFMKDIHVLVDRLTLQDERFGGLGKSIGGYLDSLLGQKVQDPDDPTGKKTISFDELFTKWIDSGGSPSSPYYQELDKVLNDWAPNANESTDKAGDGPAPTDKFTQITNNLKSVTTAINDQSSIVQQQIQQIESKVQQQLGVVKGMFDKLISWGQQIVDNMSRAGA